MKKVSVLFISLLFIGFSAMAQRGGNGKAPSPQERAERQAKIMKVDLGLNDAQYEQLLALNLKQAEKASVKRAEMKDKMEENREARKAAREAYKTELESILTPEQFEKHELMVKERQGKRGEGRGGNRSKRGNRERN